MINSSPHPLSFDIEILFRYKDPSSDAVPFFPEA